MSEKKYYLAKTDPETYTIEKFKADKCTTWDGVSNPQAVAAIKHMTIGDRVLIYHSGGETSIRGVARVISKPKPDLKNPKSWVVDLEFLEAFKPPYITLKQIKETKKFNDFTLVYQSRLSTMEVPETFIRWLKKQGLAL